MNRPKTIISLFLIMFSIIKAMSQDEFDLKIMALKNQYPVPVLAKTKMYADFDTLISIMKRCNPQYLVRKAVTGYDMIAEMKAQRAQIENCNNTLDFIRLVKNILSLTLDEHCSIGSNVWWYSHSFYENDVKINNITNKEYGINFHYQDVFFGDNEPYIDFICVQGRYFLRNKTAFFNHIDSIVLPLGTEIVTFNNNPIAASINAIKTNETRWNFIGRTHYNSVLNISNPQNNIGFKRGKNMEEYVFTEFIQEEEYNFSKNQFYYHYFAKDSLFYFRTPKMIAIDIARLMQLKETIPEISIPEWQINFEKEVLNYSSFPIKSVIIDIRGNTGGNDLAWKEFLLSLIIKNPVEYPFCLITNDDKDVFLRNPPETNKKVTFDFIDPSHQFCVFEEEIDTIKPSVKNLGYDETIYLLVDEDCYSSALGLASLCTKTSRIQTIGMPTGKIGGQGVAANVFVLPHSRFIFTLDLFLDASTVSKAEDFYHNHINYPITPSIDYYKYWYNPARYHIIDEKAMYEHDEVFLKALEIIKSRKQ